MNVKLPYYVGFISDFFLSVLAFTLCILFPTNWQETVCL